MHCGIYASGILVLPLGQKPYHGHRPRKHLKSGEGTAKKGHLGYFQNNCFNIIFLVSGISFRNRILQVAPMCWKLTLYHIL